MMTIMACNFLGFAVLIVLVYAPAEGLKCLRCDAVLQPILCNNITTCGQSEVCGIERISNENGNNRYNLGCKSSRTCSAHKNATNHGQTKLSNSGASAAVCQDCCNQDICNSAGCGEQGYPGNIGPVCMDCEDISNPRLCKKIKACETGQICEAFIQGPDPIGRKKRETSYQLKRSTLCLNCCSTNLCNNHCGKGDEAFSITSTESTKQTTLTSVSTTSIATTTGNQTAVKPVNASSKNGIGRQFLIVFTSNYNKLRSRFINFLINSDKNGWYHIYVPYLGIYENRSLDASYTAFNLSELIIPESFVKENKSIWLETSTDVSVYALNIEDDTSEGFYVIPVKDLSSEYVLVTEEPYTKDTFPDVHVSEVSVSATMNDTTINFRFNTNGTIKYKQQMYNNDRDLTIQLNQYETFRLEHKHDLTGTVVTSSKPIAVVSGNRCGNVFGYACSHLVEMITPVKSLGKQYIIPVFTSGFGKRFVRIVGTYNDTDVNYSVDGLMTNASISSSNSVDRLVNNKTFMSVSSSKPMLISVLVQSSSHGQGPFMVIIPDVDRYLSHYNFAVPDAGFTSSISIIIKSTSVSGLRLDGKFTSKSFSMIKGTFLGEEYSLMEYPVSHGSHNLYHITNDKFGLFVYGNRSDDGYGYHGGMKFN